MLEWSLLSSRQRITCICATIILASGLAASIISEPRSPSNTLGALAAALLFASLLLNPALARGQLSHLIRAPFPAPCRALAVASFAALFLSRAAHALS